MSIITFINKDMKESGQTLSVAAIATLMAIEHNYRILVISTDFNDKTMEDCFFNSIGGIGGKIKNLYSKSLNADIANGLEGLIRMFASNRADKDVIRSYTKPILKDRLDILQPPKTKDFKEYSNISTYFSQIADVANTAYDMVLVDLSNKVSEENTRKLMDISSLVVVGLNQNMKSMINFEMLKKEDEFYRRTNVLILIGKYNLHSKYTAKNIGRFLKEKNVPIVVPYSILFADDCTEGKILDYFLSLQALRSGDTKNLYFCAQVREAVEKIDYLRQAYEFGLNK